MILYIITFITMLVGFFLYKNLRKKINNHANFTKNLLSSQEIREKLNNKFTGYLLCLDAINFPKNDYEIQQLQYVHNKKLEQMLIFDGSSVFPIDSDLASIMKIEKFPALISVNKGQPISNILINPSDPSVFKSIDQFIVLSPKGKIS